MKTVTAAEARDKLPSLLKRAKAGEEFGIISGDAIIQLKRVDVVPWEDTYLFQEYGVTSEEWERFRKKCGKRRAKEKYVSFDGPFDPRNLDLHSGIGLRKLRGEFYEVRIGLKKRLVFEDSGDALIFELLGSHDGVKRFMRSR